MMKIDFSLPELPEGYEWGDLGRSIADIRKIGIPIPDGYVVWLDAIDADKGKYMLLDPERRDYEFCRQSEFNTAEQMFKAAAVMCHLGMFSNDARTEG